MTQSLVLVGLFLCVLVSLPFLIEHLKKRYGLGVATGGGPARMVSALALGPQQKVVTVEVGPVGARVWLVLGVTPQSIRCLHTMPAAAGEAPVVAVSTQASYPSPGLTGTST